MAKITLDEWKGQNGVNSEADLESILYDASDSGICPALCDEGCEAEPDGHCPHGAESLMLALGII